MRKLRLSWIFAGLALTLCGMPLFAQTWVDTFGTQTQYQPPDYLSGYGVSDLPQRGERLEAARNAALAQLSRQVRVQITSEESIRTSDYGDGVRNRYINTVAATSDLHVSGADFEIVERRRETHVLAWVPIARLTSQFSAGRDAARSLFSNLIEQFDQSIGRGDLEQAERDLVRLDTALSALTDATSVLRALVVLSGRPVSSVESVAVTMQSQLEQRRDQMRAFQPQNVEQAANYLARLISRELGTVERVTPLLYETADFSSAFGSRFAGLLEAALSRMTGQGTSSVVVRGSYWPQDDEIEIQVTAREIDTGRDRKSVV